MQIKKQLIIFADKVITDLKLGYERVKTDSGCDAAVVSRAHAIRLLVLVRYVAMVAFGYMAYKYDEVKNAELTVTFGALAVLFQPFIKIALGRTIWNIVDVVVAVLLVFLVVKEWQGNKKDK